MRIQPRLDGPGHDFDKIFMPLPARDPGRQCQDKLAVKLGMRARPLFPPGPGRPVVIGIFLPADTAVNERDFLRADGGIVFQDIVPDVFRDSDDLFPRVIILL